MIAGTKRPVVVFEITTESGQHRTLVVPLTHDTGPGRLAALQVARTLYPHALTIAPGRHVLRTDGRSELDTPLPSPEVTAGEGSR